LKQSEVIKVVIGVLLFFTVAVSYAFEFKYIVNTITTLKIFIIAGIASLFFVAIVWRKFIKLSHEIFEKFIITNALLVMSFALMPLIVSLLNRQLGQRTSVMTAYELIEVVPKSEQPYGILDSAAVEVDGFRIRIKTNNGEESLYVKNKSSFRQENQRIYLPMKRGGLGLYFLDES